MTFLDDYWSDYDYSYAAAFSTSLAKNFIIISGVALMINILFGLFIARFIKSCCKKNQTIIPNQEVSINQIQELETDKYNYIEKRAAAIILETGYIISFWVFIITASLISVAYSSFGFFPSINSLFCLFVSGILAILFQIWRSSNFWYGNRSKTIQHFKNLLIFELFFVAFISVFIPYSFSKGCICTNNSAYGVDIFGNFQFSTQLTRSLWLPEKICKNNIVCHIYATLPENTSSEVFINVHTGQDIKELNMIFIDKQENKLEFECEFIKFPSQIEERGQRNLFTCYANNLKSSTSYQVNLYFNNELLKSTRYITLPEYGSENDLKIFFGGDWGYMENGLLITNQISLIEPDVILIGGDIAYDNGIIHCYYSSDLLLFTFEEQFNKLNRIIPFIFSIGNHDIGANYYSSYNVSVSNEFGPLYFIYFPQKAQNNKSVSVENRVPFNSHAIQNLLILGLDSGYLYSHNGSQYEWMKQKLNESKYQNYLKFAHYHVPIYPTCLKNNQTYWEYLPMIKETWVALFDKYEFVGAFENHVHQYKRTYPLKNSKRAEKGTVYFGDGSMGIRQEDCREESKSYGEGRVYNDLFETAAYYQSTHFWILQFFGKNETIDFRAYYPDNTFIPNSTYITVQDKSKKEDL